jgi:2-polyprenyl-6-methoxyphenol hydroxylase-like FAD-dependent oxidoreductase
MPPETRAHGRRVHVIGGGPVGLMMTALLQTMGGFSIRLYEKRREYTRTRMVKLDSYLVADSVENYCVDHIDGENVEAVFDRTELEEGVAFRRSIASDLKSLLHQWTQGFCPLNTIERSLSELIDLRGSNSVERVAAAVTVDQAVAMLEPEDILIDCSGSNSLLRDHLVPQTGEVSDQGANTFRIRLEYALVVTFLYSQKYVCDEYCKYYKNAGNDRYKFIPAVYRTFFDHTVSHVTGIVSISPVEYEAMPSRFDGQWLRDNFPGVAESMDRFIHKIKSDAGGDILGELEIIRIPLDLYHARNATSRKWRAIGLSDHPFAGSPVFLAGDSAIGSPYFQSISLGLECAMFLAGLLGERGQSPRDIFNRYETYIYKQWLRVYMRSKMIKHNKDLLESLDDRFALLERLHIY